ncbi:MAG TPA: hypothetical protein VFS20_29215 [Longimicrobium sp.]|nr:hypothetical protein [Longimicrobium sp.]
MDGTLPTPDGAPRNRILAALPPGEWERLRGGAQRVPLEIRKVLIEPHRTIEHVYFVESGVVCRCWG